jgi:hypothetical protein
VIAVHHGTKQDGAIRGHSSLPGALDTILKVTADKEGIVRLEFEKQKDGEELRPVYFRRVVVDVSRPADAGIHDVGADTKPTSVALVRLQKDEEQKRIGSGKVRRLTMRQRNTLRALIACGERGATQAEWRDAAQKADGKLSRQTFDAQVVALVEDHGLARVVTARDGDGVYIADARAALALKELDAAPTSEGGE